VEQGKLRDSRSSRVAGSRKGAPDCSWHVDVLHGGKVCSKETSDDGHEEEQRDAPSNCGASIECSSGRCHEERLGLLAEQARTTGLLELLQNDCAAARLEAARWEREVTELASRAAEVLWLRPLM
jgi:hypothetical protein